MSVGECCSTFCSILNWAGLWCYWPSGQFLLVGYVFFLFFFCVCFLSIYLIYSDFLDSTGYAGGFAGIPKFIGLYVG